LNLEIDPSRSIKNWKTKVAKKANHIYLTGRKPVQTEPNVGIERGRHGIILTIPEARERRETSEPHGGI
jgi:hypothetical protein